MTKESTDQRPYHPCYCEENVWHLCSPRWLAGRRAEVAFISNAGRRVALFEQRAAGARGLPVVWDYHVVLLVREASGWEAWDDDSLLATPAHAGPYLDATFGPAVPFGPDYAPRFRLLDATVYRRALATDRRHMRRPDGSYLEPPPPWPPIGEGSNLMRFIDMETEFLGEVVDLEELRRRLGLEDLPRRPLG